MMAGDVVKFMRETFRADAFRLEDAERLQSMSYISCARRRACPFSETSSLTT